MLPAKYRSPEDAMVGRTPSSAGPKGTPPPSGLRPVDRDLGVPSGPGLLEALGRPPRNSAVSINLQSGHEYFFEIGRGRPPHTASSFSLVAPPRAMGYSLTGSPLGPALYALLSR